MVNIMNRKALLKIKSNSLPGLRDQGFMCKLGPLARKKNNFLCGGLQSGALTSLFRVAVSPMQILNDISFFMVRHKFFFTRCWLETISHTLYTFVYSMSYFFFIRELKKK